MAILASVSWSLLDPLVLIAVFTCSWVFWHRVYNRWFHPLSHVPGPFYGRMSPWPSTFHALKGDRHLWIEHCFNKYGNRIRIEPNTVLFRSATAARDIYSTKSNVKKSQFYDALMRKDSDRNTISTTDNVAHAKRRKLLNLAFTEKSLRASAVFMHRHIDRWNELLASDDTWSAPVDFAVEADRLVFDILGDICFGKSFEIKEPGENPIKRVPHAVIKTLSFLYPITKSPFLPALPWLRPRGLSAVFDAIRSPPIRFYDNFVEVAVTERLRLEEASKSDPKVETREDMFHFIANAKNPDEPTLTAFSKHDMVGEAKLLLVAGSDSTSVTMSGMFYYLSHYPDVLAKLRHEILSTFSSADDIVVGPKLSSCKYMRACIDETMRMCPAGTSELPREVLPGGIVIDGEYYPAGTVVGTARWADGYNAEVYGRDVNEFRPGRWIADADNSAEAISRLKATFQPFSQGPFNCAGTNFALQELTLMVAKTVHRLEFRLAQGAAVGEGEGQRVPLFQLQDAYISVKHGPMMQFRRRARN